jgi:hypothetical protein
MALTRKELLQSGGIAHQESLVKRLQEQIAMPPMKRLIPGGKTLLEQLDQETMEKAVYNWLRGCRAFSQVTISFAKNPEQYQCKTEKIRDYNTAGPREEWETHPEGRQHLARHLAEILNSHRVVKVVAKRDGIWLYKDVNNQFAPVKTVTKEDVEEQTQLVDEVRAEMIANGEDPDTLVYTPFHVGDEIAAEDWEPYIEFIPKRKQEYGR